MAVKRQQPLEKNKILKDFEKVPDWSDRGVLFYKKYGRLFEDQKDEVLLFIAIFQPIRLAQIKEAYGSEGIESVNDFVKEGKVYHEKSMIMVSKKIGFKMFGKII